jgi:hypothetical protein
MKYSIAIGIGIAGTVEVYVRDGDVLRGYRAAMWVSVALSSFALVFSVAYAATAKRETRK